MPLKIGDPMLMRKIFGALLLTTMIVGKAQAASTGVTIFDMNDQPLGTPINPLTVTGGSGGGGNAATTSNGSDGQTPSNTNQQNVVYNYVFNGTAWDRVRGTGGFIGTFLSAPLPAGTNQIGTLNDAVTPAGYPATASAAAAQPTIDTAGYGSVEFQIAGTFSATITFQGSDDLTNWFPVGGTLNSSVGFGADTQTITTPGSIVVGAHPRYLRTNVTTYTSGTATIVAFLRNAPYAPRGVYIGGSITLPAYSNATAFPGGIASYSRIPSSAATTNTTVTKASAGRVYKIFACNTTTSAAFIKFYNTSTVPTVGTTTVMFSRPILPAASAGGLNCASYDMSDVGWYFSSGISFAITTGNADNDNTALTAGQITQLSIEYQ
jgi:hypothetical protein